MLDGGDTGDAPPLVAAAEAAFTRAHASNLAASMAARDANLTAWLEAFEQEHAGVLQTVLSEILDHPSMPAGVRDVLGGITNPVHQTQVLLGLFSVGSIVMQFVGAAIAPEVQAVSNLAWSENPDAPLPPAELAVGVLKGWVTEGAAASEAHQSGLNAERFHMLTLINGEPPGPQELMEALRRGVIDHERFALGIRESRVRPEWLDVLTALRYSPLPMGTAVAAAIQGHISKGELSTHLDHLGIDPRETEVVFETAGRPPGVFELAELVNRGELSVETLKQAVRESDIKDKYIDALVLLRRKIPPMRSVVAAVHQGVLPAEAGLKKLMELGYNADDAAIFVKEATALKHAGTKNLSQGMVHNLYAQRMITRPAAATMLGDLGFDATEVGFILDLADHERAAHAQTTAVARVHARYVSYHLDRTHATTALDAIGVDPQGREDLLGAWDDERVVNAPKLTLSQLDGLIHRKMISQHEYQRGVLALGYDAALVPLLYSLAFPPTKPGPDWKL